MTRDAKRARDRHAASVRRYHDKVMREVLEGERPYNSIPKVNRKRKAKLYARNFGDKRPWIAACPCEVTGVTEARGYKIDAAHMVKRSVGGDLTSLVPLWHPVHVDFDDELLSDHGFEVRWGRTRESIRATAPEYHEEWLNRGAQEDAA